jgi:hypothetical protein
MAQDTKKTQQTGPSAADTDETAKKAAEAEAEQAKAAEQQPGAPGGISVTQPPQAAAAAFAGLETTTMVFPKRVTLQHKPGQLAVFDAGTQEVPNDLVDHPYLKANGVKKYESKKK